MYAPCYQCEERILHCHSRCEKYHGYREVIDEANRKKKAILEMDALENYRFCRTGST